MQIPIFMLFTYSTGCTHELQLPLEGGKIAGVTVGRQWTPIIGALAVLQENMAHEGWWIQCQATSMTGTVCKSYEMLLNPTKYCPGQLTVYLSHVSLSSRLGTVSETNPDSGTVCLGSTASGEKQCSVTWATTLPLGKNSDIFYFIQNSATCTLLIDWFIYLEGIVYILKLPDLCSPARETPITVSLVLFLAKLKGCNSSLLLLTFLPLSWLRYFPLPCLASLSRVAFSASSQREKINSRGTSEPESRVTRGDQEQITSSQHSSCVGSWAQFPND